MILKKLGDEYKLYNHDSCIATTYESPYKKLSLKNCQAIERGCDFDEYQEGVFYAGQFGHPSPEGFSDEQVGRLHGFIDGFQKALEILGDNKELIIKLNDLLDGLNSFKYQVKASYLHFDCEQIIKSLQQTEWDCTFNPEEKDADGCLILKRK